MRAAQPGEGHGLPHDLSDTSSAQQNPMDYDRTSIDADFPLIDARKLCILGLPWDTTDEELQHYFGQFGPLESAAIIRKSRTGESRGFGFVTYQSASDAQMVLVQEHSIGGRHIDAKQALPRGNSNPNRETRLFVGKLPPDLTDIELRDHFEKFGKVQDAYIPKDASNGKQGHRGFGFVTFANADDVDKVLQCAHTIRQTDLAVQCAVPKDKTAEIQARNVGISKVWPFPLAESYPSSNDSLTTIGVPSHSIYGSIGSGIPHHPGTVQSMWSTHPPRAKPLPITSERLPSREGHFQAEVASSSGREHPPYPGNRILAGVSNLEASHLERLSLPSMSNSQRSSLDYTPSKRHGVTNSYNPESAAQALQGLTFAPSTQQNLGFSLALLQQAQANDNPQQFLGNRFVPHPGLGGASGYPQASNLATSRTIPAQPPVFQNPALDRLAAAQSAINFSPRPSPLGASFGAFNATAGPPDARAGPRMFVGKLNKDISEQDIKDYMSQFGYVLDVYMPRDKVKRTEHRGFGFVTFETAAAIERVALNAPHRIKGSIVVVDEAAPRREELGDVHLDGASILRHEPSALPEAYMADMGLQTSRLGGAGMAVGSPQESHFHTGIGSPGSNSIGTSPRILQSTSGISGVDLAHQYLTKQSSLDGRSVPSQQVFLPGGATYSGF